MVEIGDPAPDFTVPKAGGAAYNDVEQFTLSENVGDGPVVLAFVPAAFTSACTEELCSFRDSMARFNALDAQVFGVSVDLPFAQNIWIEEENLTFPLLSDWTHEVIHDYDVVLEDMYDVVEVARRSIVVLDTEGVVTFRKIYDTGDPDIDLDVIERAIQDAS